MSDFSDGFVACMTGKNLPAPVLDTANDVLEMVHQLHSSLEASGFDMDVTLGALAAAGVLAPGVAGAVSEAGEVAAPILVGVFLTACVACMVSNVGAALQDLLASNPPDDFVQGQLAQLGSTSTGEAIA